MSHSGHRRTEECGVSDIETILEVGAEGGNLRLLGRLDPDGRWLFRTTTRDQTLTFLADEERDNELRGESAWTDDWSAAMTRLDRYPWPTLWPVSIHPAFQDHVLAEVSRRLMNDHTDFARRRMEQWLARCGPRPAGRQQDSKR